MHKELIRQLLLHLSLLNADFTIQGLLFSDFQIKAFKEKYLITNRVKNEDCKIQLRELRKFQVLPLHFAPSQASSSQNSNVHSYLKYCEVDSLKRS